MAPVKIPKIDERNKIIERAHLQGHFNAQSTLQRIQMQYYWVKKAIDVINFVNKCLKCKRKNKGKVFHHPARPNKLLELFESIAMDLVLGLPSENREKYIGILVITEYLTKYPFAAPIRSKQAIEIADILFNYISIFGPSKIILNDNGGEFVNAIMDNLLTKIGTEHRVTSAYHPNTNGQTERLNLTLIISLRKHCEAHPNDWYAWLPYILMSYRTRLHSVTGFSPFYLMFGREMLSFENWSHETDVNDVLAIENRTNEIKNHFEQTIPSTVEIINKKKERQTKIKDKANNILEQTLAVGTTVYLKNDGLLTKLEPQYFGPYTVASITKCGNYKLKNTENIILNKSYPLEKLKLTKETDNSDQIFTVEKIIDDRIFRRQQQYFVKWKGYSKSNNSWENEENFSSMQPVQLYWHQKQHFQPTVSTQSVNVRRSKR